MRVLLLISALAAATFATAQRPANATEAEIYDAYVNGRTGEGFVFEMKGAETYGRVSTAVHAVLYYRLVNDPRTGADTMAQAELDVYTPTTTGETIAYRAVGDGNTLYRYDINGRTVSASLYGAYSNAPISANAAAAYPRNLLAKLRALTPGLATYLVRLADEMNPIGDLYTPRYATWLPGASILPFDGVPIPIRTLNPSLNEASYVTDPVTRRTFVRGDDEYVFFGDDRSTTARTVTFHMVDLAPKEQPPIWNVQAVNVGLRTPGRVVDLVLVPNATTAFPNWAFVPYTGAQGAAFRPVAGG